MSKLYITPKERKALNKSLRFTLKKTYFSSIPLESIFKVAEYEGLVIVQEDNTPWSGFLCGDSDQCFFRMGRVETMKKVNGLETYELIENSGLQLSWYKMESGRYEVCGYFS